MAAVCGSLGDCYQRLGDPAQAEQLYHESMAAVESLSNSDAEAAHALSVSLNKLGDMRYSQEQLQQAKQLYRRALQLRQLACGPLTGGRAGPGQQLELASSLIKVADVCRVSCGSGAAFASWTYVEKQVEKQLEYLSMKHQLWQ
jgi:tetratricopeptide (TPR) repeat protein